MIKVEVAYSIYEPKGDPIGLVQIAHGMSEHRKRYVNFANYLLSQGYAVIINDHRGHGESIKDEKELGYFAAKDGWFLAVEDLHQISLLIKEKYPHCPLYLFGHSMGALLARSYLKRYDADLAGLILCGAPNYNSAAPLALLLAKTIKCFRGPFYRSKLLNSLSFGSFNSGIANPKTEFDWLSINEENVKHYQEDPLCSFVFTTNGFIDLLEGMKDMHDASSYRVSQADLPILFVAGAEDPCIGKEKGLKNSIDTLKKAGYHHIESKLYPGLRHEILNELEADQVMQDLNQWLKQISNV